MDQLLKKAQGHDTQAKEEIITFLYQDLLKYCFFTISRREVAEEICHDVMIKAINELHSFTNVKHLTLWCYRVSKNAFIDFTRKKQNSDHAIPDLNYEDFAGDEEDISQTLDILKTLEQLSFEERQVITLVDLQGHSYQEAAQVIEITESAVRSRLHKARKNFIEKHRNDS